VVARLIEGWESSTTLADYAGKWTTWSGTPAVAPSSGRFGNGLRLTSGANNIQRTFDGQVTWVVGFGLRLLATPIADYAVCSLFDTAVAHCGLGLTTSSSQLFAWRGTPATVIGTSTPSLSAGTWYYVEIKATISDAAGVFVVRLNGATVLNLTAVDTRNAGNASANTVRLGTGPGTTFSSGQGWDVDDVYVFDASGPVNNDFAGDCRVQQLLPNGAGATTAWTPSAGSNYACVDEVPPNADTDYVASATAGQTDTYAFGDLSVTGAVKAVQATALARKDDAGSRSIALVARPGSTDRVGATQAVLDTYTAMTELWDTNPDTAAAWSVAEVNASSFGVRLIA
jgi:hypothetical protein